MDLFIDSKATSLAAYYLINYAKVPQVNYIDVSKHVQKHVTFPSLPCLISSKFCLRSYPGILTTLASLSSAHKILLGSNNIENSQILYWLVQSQKIKEKLENLNQYLLSRVFLVSTHITLADISIYAGLQKLLVSFSEEEKFQYTNIVRWACHVQSLPGLDILVKEKVSKPDLSKGVKSQYLKQIQGEENQENQISKKQQKKQQKAQQKEPEESKQKNQQSAQQKAPEEQKKQEKPQKQKAQKQQKQPEQERPPLTRMDFRVGKILKAWKHPSADRLYCEEIDIGGEIRQIASGLVEHVPIEEMQGRMVIVIANLKARKLVGFQSHGMVMCASNKEKIEILIPPEGSQVGDKVFFPGFEMNPDSELHPKKGYWEAVQPLFKTGEDLIARFENVAFTTDKGVVTTSTIKSGNVS